LSYTVTALVVHAAVGTRTVLVADARGVGVSNGNLEVGVAVGFGSTDTLARIDGVAVGAVVAGEFAAHARHNAAANPSRHTNRRPINALRPL
jgi:hypothetical protein